MNLKHWAGLENWVHRPVVDARDLGIFRIVYSALVLLTLPRFSWVASFPAFGYNAPPGPFRFLTGPPPLAVVTLLDLLLLLGLGMLLVGYRTTVASLVVGVGQLLLYGFTYSFGRLDHTIFVVLTPLVLAAAHWGAAFSADSTARRRRSDRRRDGWPLRWLAVLIGVGFLTAALAKLRGGWLNPSTQAARFYLFDQFYGYDRTQLLAPLAVHFRWPLFWEAFDWATVAFEAGVLVSALHWRAFRALLAVGTLFHLGVWLMMNIVFPWNVISYGAFVEWNLLANRLPSGLQRAMGRGITYVTSSDLRSITVGVGAALVGLGAQQSGVVTPILNAAILLIGAAAGSLYLLVQLRLLGRFVRALTGRRAEPVQVPQ